MKSSNPIRLFWTKVSLWALVGAACGVLGFRAWVDAAPGPAGFTTAWGPWLGVLGLLVYLVIVAIEMARRTSLALIRWIPLVGVLVLASAAGSPYLLVLADLAVSAGIMALVALVVLLVMERGTRTGDPHMERPTVDTLSSVFISRPWFGGAQTAVFSLVIGAVVGVVLLELGGLTPVGPVWAETEAPRTVAVARVANPTGPASHALLLLPSDERVDETADVASALLIDGNRRDKAVLFDHAGHRERLGGEDSCGTCHHLNRPLDLGTDCATCHVQMSRPATVFGHERHVDALGGNASCATCHPEDKPVKTAANSKPCAECHRGGEPQRWFSGDIIDLPTGDVPSYADAMHVMCVSCHRAEEAERGVEQPYLSLCTNCHRYRTTATGAMELDDFEADPLELPPGWVVMPPVSL